MYWFPVQSDSRIKCTVGLNLLFIRTCRRCCCRKVVYMSHVVVHSRWFVVGAAATIVAIVGVVNSVDVVVVADLALLSSRWQLLVLSPCSCCPSPRVGWIPSALWLLLLLSLLLLLLWSLLWTEIELECGCCCCGCKCFCARGCWCFCVRWFLRRFACLKVLLHTSQTSPFKKCFSASKAAISSCSTPLRRQNTYVPHFCVRLLEWFDVVRTCK